MTAENPVQGTPAAGNIVVEAIGLTKEFRDFWNRPKAKAVNDIDFTVREGEVVGLLGPNGSGKSTTVKMLLGLLYPTAGRLSVFGKSPRDVDTKKLIGYLPEESYLYKYLTAYETLDFFGSLFSLSAEERKKRTSQLLEMVGLEHAKDRPVGEFSKGMIRRIGLAQAMINDPAFLILDEPTSGLDPLGCREVKDLILMLKKRGKTVIVTSHLLSDIEDVCDRVVILYGGRIRAEGTLNELLTIQSTNRITTPNLPPAAMEKLLEVLRSNLKDEEIKIDHPRMSLEEFFLDVVNKAQAESAETYGARAGGQIADYLSSGSEDANAPSGQQLLDQLSGKVKEEIPVKEEIKEEELKPAIDTTKLQALNDDSLKAKAPAKKEEKAEEKRDLAEANRKLSSLLSGTGNDDPSGQDNE
ncbi:MAG: ABC transporter ATP-binding protein [Lentisphaeria bacterium]|nr:ABC transporter ATP-binding protein [Lentisphaeria bacterium]